MDAAHKAFPELKSMDQIENSEERRYITHLPAFIMRMLSSDSSGRTYFWSWATMLNATKLPCFRNRQKTIKRSLHDQMVDHRCNRGLTSLTHEQVIHVYQKLIIHDTNTFLRIIVKAHYCMWWNERLNRQCQHRAEKEYVPVDFCCHISCLAQCRSIN